MVRLLCSVGRAGYIIGLTLFVLSPLSSLAQGYVRLSNRVPGVLDAPIFDSTGTNKLDGSYFVEVLLGPAPDALQSGGWVRVGTGADAGYFDGSLQIGFAGSMAPGQTAFAQCRAWDYNRDWSYDSALTAGSPHGFSEVFTVTLGTWEKPAVMTGLKSFQLLPERFGTIRFENLVAGVLDAPILDVAGSRLSGTGYVAQCYARIATNQNSLAVPIGRPVPFGTGDRAGYWEAGTTSTLSLTNIGAGQIAEVQILVWDLSKGSSLEEAARAGGKRGISNPIQIKTGGGDPPGSAPPVLTGLNGFALIESAPGLINFNNYIAGILDAPVPGIGPPYVAQLYAVSRQGDFRPAGEPAPLNQAGYWEPVGDGTVVLDDVQAGDYATLQVKVWDPRAAPNYEEALLLGQTGTSMSFQVRTGGAGKPPSPPAVLRGLLNNFWVHPPHAVVVDFNNHIAGQIDAPILGRDGTRLSGSKYMAQLYAAVLQGFEPVGKPAPFGTDALAGYWQPSTDSLRMIDVPAGCCANIQVRIWDSSTGPTYESDTGDRAISRTVLYFATNIKSTLDLLGLDTFGVVWMEDFHAPIILVSQYGGTTGGWIYDIDGASFISGSNWVGQVFVAPDDPANYRPPYPGPDLSKLVPVGPIFPVREGHWMTPPNTVIPLTGFETNEQLIAVLRVWEVDHGASYAEAAANGSLLGTSYPSQPFITSLSFVNSPTEVNFSSTFSIRGHQKIITVPPGLSLLGNPFGRGAPQFLRQVATNAPDGTTLFLFRPATQSYAMDYHDFGSWTTPGLTIPFGAGFFIRNPSTQPFTMVFEGVEDKIPDITPPTAKPTFFAVSGTFAEPALLTEALNFPLVDGDLVYAMNGGLWSTTEFDGGTWSSFTPRLNPGEGVFIWLVPRAP